jgi:hypothetical protein
MAVRIEESLPDRPSVQAAVHNNLYGLWVITDYSNFYHSTTGSFKQARARSTYAYKRLHLTNYALLHVDKFTERVKPQIRKTPTVDVNVRQQAFDLLPQQLSLDV